MPIDKCEDDYFINWNPTEIVNKYIKNPVKKALFESRRRVYVYIIASSNDITFYADKFPRVFDTEALGKYV